MATTHTAQDILKTQAILECSPDTPISQATDKLRSSHDAVFVLNSSHVLGVVNPYHSLSRRRSFNNNTKAETVMFSPPRLKPSTPFPEIARLMLESKIYYLPVQDQHDKLLGIASIRRLLNAYLQDSSLLNSLPLIPITTQNLITLPQSENVITALNLMRDHKISHLPLTDDSGKLAGLLTLFDLRYLLVGPVPSQSRFSLKGNKDQYLDQPVTDYTTPMPVTVTNHPEVSSVISTMLDHDIGSLIGINTNQKPTGIITHHDVLNAIVTSQNVPV